MLDLYRRRNSVGDWCLSNAERIQIERYNFTLAVPVANALCSRANKVTLSKLYVNPCVNKWREQLKIN